MKQRKWTVIVFMVLMLTAAVGQVAQAGTPIRCGQACHTAGRMAPPPSLPSPNP